MSRALLQSFRADSSSKVVTIPAVRDTKNGNYVVRWKDIQQCFVNAHYITDGTDMVMFMTNENLEDLIPLRIAHYPGVVLEVVTLDDHQSGSGSMNNSCSTQASESSPFSRSASRLGDCQAVIRDSNSQVGSVANNVDTLRITEIDNHALVVRSGVSLPETPAQANPPLNNLQPTGEHSEQLRQMQRQMDKIQQRMQEAERLLQQQQQQQQQQQMDEALSRTFWQRYPLLGSTGAFILFVTLLYLLLSLKSTGQRTELSFQQWQESLQQTKYSIQQQQQQIDEAQKAMQLSFQQWQESQQQTIHSIQQQQQQIDKAQNATQLSYQQWQDFQQETQKAIEQQQEQIDTAQKTTQLSYQQLKDAQQQTQQATQLLLQMLETVRVTQPKEKEQETSWVGLVGAVFLVLVVAGCCAGGAEEKKHAWSI
ncbi:MAG: hypothetical protein J3Q66DRAFT_207777 [Benniella sp.]|nr:MAG: hypothetical protein J3Q66DRAFT_207777 [Benniella sp.]